LSEVTGAGLEYVKIDIILARANFPESFLDLFAHQWRMTPIQNLHKEFLVQNFLKTGL